MRTILYHTVSAATAADLDKTINHFLDEGYQLYGNPYLGDQRIEGGIVGTIFYQAMTSDNDARDRMHFAIPNEAAERKSRLRTG
jgi:uncharacterized protein DUF1737